MAREYVIEGSHISSLETFYEQISDVVIPGANWGKNLDAFNDVLRGAFGTPENGFVLRWKNADASRKRLGVRTFDTLVEIILDHGQGGDQAEDNVTLILE